MISYDLNQKQETVRVFLKNLIDGNISMDQKKYLKKKPKRFVDKFQKYVRIFQSYDASNNDSDVPQRLTKVTSWLFDAILEGRTCSAINGVVEKHIQEIDKESLRNLRLMIDHLQVKTA